MNIEKFIEYLGSGGFFGGFNAIRGYIGVTNSQYDILGGPDYGRRYAGVPPNYVYPYGNYLNYSTQPSPTLPSPTLPASKPIEKSGYTKIVGV